MQDYRKVLVNMSISLSPHIRSPFYSLEVQTHRWTTSLTMRLTGRHVTTQGMSQVVPLLREHLPSIFASTCFNDLHLPFYHEVKKTELAHLYEHILLEKLTLLSQRSLKIYKGVTSWDWNKETFGTFHIRINTTMIESLLLRQALAESNTLMDLILKSTQAN